MRYVKFCAFMRMRNTFKRAHHLRNNNYYYYGDNHNNAWLCNDNTHHKCEFIFENSTRGPSHFSPVEQKIIITIKHPMVCLGIMVQRSLTKSESQ